MTPIVMERMPPKLSHARTTAPSITFLQRQSQLGHLIQSQCVTWEPLNSHKQSREYVRSKGQTKSVQSNDELGFDSLTVPCLI